MLANHHDGTFNKWVEERCGFAKRSAYNYMRAFQVFGSCATVAQLDASAMYALSADTCPESAREEAIKLAENGEHITLAIANKGDGTFIKWVEERCKFSRQTAWKYISAFKTFGECKPGLHSFDVSAMYALNAESCPEAARDNAIKRAENGEHITLAIANKLIEAETVGDSANSANLR